MGYAPNLVSAPAILQQTHLKILVPTTGVAPDSTRATILRSISRSPTLDVTRPGGVNVSEASNGSIDGHDRQFLLQLWSTQLNCPQLGAQDDFFEAGGSSMQVIEMLMTVSSKFGKEIDYAEFFQNPCVDRLTQLLEARG